ncbi:MAG TPA: DUF2330 domain-containing protein [Phycisphaerae bacterium]|nr:DUF2330 domain-containing protein [Phycisphaerae bacterium]
MNNGKRPAKCAIIAFVFISGVVPCKTTIADGFFATPMPVGLGTSSELVTSPKQEAFISTDGKIVGVVLRTHFNKGPKELAWVVPVPGKPEGIEAAEDSIFSNLDQATAPRFYQTSGKGYSGLSCGCAASPQYMGIDKSTVNVESTGTAGIFKYTVLSASDADDLTKWLIENKYAIPIGSERVFKLYVKKGWYWLAMKVRPEVSDEKTLAPHPVKYWYRDDKVIYPMAISQLSAALTNEIVLYIAGPQRYACANWANMDIADLVGGEDGPDLKVDYGSSSGTNYEKLFRTAAEQHKAQLFVTEHASAGTLGWVFDKEQNQFPNMTKPVYLTRMRGLLTPESMDRDVLLIPVTGPRWDSFEGDFKISGVSGLEPSVALAAIPLAPLGLLFLAGPLARRSKRWRAVSFLCVTSACIIFAML